jgi:peptide/nickel transport system permease protein
MAGTARNAETGSLVSLRLFLVFPLPSAAAFKNFLPRALPRAIMSAMLQPKTGTVPRALRLVTVLFKTLFFALLILFISSLPLVIRQSEGRLVLRPAYFLMALDFLEGLAGGRTLNFAAGDFRWHVLRELPAYFLLSLFYMLASCFCGLLVGLPLGVARYRRRFAWSQRALFLLNSFPDFFLIMVLQLAVASLTQLTGIRLASIAMVNRPPLLLPIIALSLYPALYLMRIMATATHEISCQNYILCARARGFSRRHIFLREILPGLIPVLENDLSKLTLMILSNLFIAEQLFLLQGITRIMFLHGFTQRTVYGSGGYQYALTVSGLLYVFLLFLITRALLGLVVRLLRRMITRDR